MFSCDNAEPGTGRALDEGPLGVQSSFCAAKGVRDEGFQAGVDIGDQSGIGVAFPEALEDGGGSGGSRSGLQGFCKIFGCLRLRRLTSYSQLQNKKSKSHHIRGFQNIVEIKDLHLRWTR